MAEHALTWVDALLGGARPPPGTQAIGRAFRLLRALSGAGPAGLGLTELARATGLTRPTTHRILAALVTEAVVVQNARTARYVLQQSFAPSLQEPSLPLFAAAVPYLDDAARVIGDTLFLTLRSGRETVCVARRLGSHPIQVLAIDVGARRPLGVSSAGIALLAGMPGRQAGRILRANARALLAYGLSLQHSSDAVRDARRRGFALRERGLIPGTKAVSVWFAPQPQGAAAALTVAGVARRLPAARVDQLAMQLRRYADQIDEVLRSSPAAGLATSGPASRSDRCATPRRDRSAGAGGRNP